MEEILYEIYYNSNSYPIMIWQNDITIPLEQYGMKPGYIESDCRYICSFEITNGLYLNKLKFCERDDQYRSINGVPPHIMTMTSGDCLSTEEIRYAYYFGVNIMLPYTGKLLLGEPANSHPLIPGGNEWPWSAKRLFELEFKDGHLINKIDYSDLAFQMRENIKKRKPLNDSERLDELFKMEEDELSDSLYFALEPLNLPLWWLHMGTFEGVDEQKMRSFIRSNRKKMQEERQKRIDKLFERYDYLIDV